MPSAMRTQPSHLASASPSDAKSAPPVPNLRWAALPEQLLQRSKMPQSFGRQMSPQLPGAFEFHRSAQYLHRAYSTAVPACTHSVRPLDSPFFRRILPVSFELSDFPDALG